jgi:ribosomal protein S18 acetylase RimI-like enzyme
MHITFRPIRPEEIPEASYLVDAAYAPQVRELYGATRRGRWQHYDEAKIKSYVEREEEGVRVGLWRDKLITLNICRSYGSLGWFHTLAVHPKFQNQGIGRQAVEDAETYLSNRGVTSLALMTWPTAIKNLAFYQQQGYRLTGLSVYAYREASTPLISGASPFYAQTYGSFPPDDEARAQDAMRALCQKITLGLDYTAWVTWTQRQSFAETLLLWRDGQLQALAISHFLPNLHWAEGKLLLLAPALSDVEQRWALEHLRLWVRSRQRDTFGFPVDLTSDFARALLLPQNFKLFAESMVNMVKGADLPDPAVHFVRFGG